MEEITVRYYRKWMRLLASSLGKYSMVLKNEKCKLDVYFFFGAGNSFHFFYFINMLGFVIVYSGVSEIKVEWRRTKVLHRHKEKSLNKYHEPI